MSKDLVERTLAAARALVAATGATKIVFCCKCPNCQEHIADDSDNTCHEFMECIRCGTRFEVQEYSMLAVLPSPENLN